MDSKVIVNSAGLQDVSTQLSSNSEKIYSLYSTEIVSILNSCEEELKVSGLDYNNVSDAFKKMFTGLHSQIDGLVDVLNNTIIPEYEGAAQSITKMFNSDFASQMNDNLKVMSKDL